MAYNGNCLDSDTLYFEVPKDKYDEILEHTGADLYLNESWALGEEDFTGNPLLFKSMMTTELYERIESLFLTERIKYIELLRSIY